MLTPTLQKINRIGKLSIYTAGLFHCLSDSPAFSANTKKNPDKYIAISSGQTKKDTTRYSNYIPSIEKQILRKEVDIAIKALDSLIQSDKHTYMNYSFLQSKRHLRIANRYIAKAYYASALQDYSQSLAIVDSISGNLDPLHVQEHRYKINIGMAKAYMFQPISKDDVFMHDRGMQFAQEAENIVAKLIEAYPDKDTYKTRYYNAMFERSSLAINAKRYVVAYILSEQLMDWYTKQENQYMQALVAQNQSIIAEHQDDITTAIQLKDQTTYFFKEYFTKQEQQEDVNYKMHLLRTIKLLCKQGEFQQAKKYWNEQKHIQTTNEDISIFEEKLEQYFSVIDLGFSDSQLSSIFAIFDELETIQNKQSTIDAARGMADFDTRNRTAKAEAETEIALSQANEAKAKAQAAKEAQAREKAEREKAQAQAREALEREQREKAEREKAQAQAALAKEQVAKKEVEAQVAQTEKRNIQLILGAALLGLLGALGTGRTLKKKNNRIQYQNNELSQKNKTIEEQESAIRRQHKHLSEGVNAAAEVQALDLANARAVLKQHLPSHFIFHSPHRPEYGVSGDFYRATQKSNKTYLVTGDCTGHGTRGFARSTMITMMLHQIFEDVVQDTGYVLDAVRQKIKLKNMLHEKNIDGSEQESKIPDGMDATICCYDKEYRELEFAGGNHSVYIVRQKSLHIDIDTPADKEYEDNEGKYLLLEYGGDRQPVGEHALEKDFTARKVTLKPGDMIYTLSDGYQDQFGGTNEKKFQKKGLRNILLSLGGKSPKEQKSIVEKAFYDRKGDIEQTDDVLVIGIQIPSEN